LRADGRRAAQSAFSNALRLGQFQRPLVSKQTLNVPAIGIGIVVLSARYTVR